MGSFLCSQQNDDYYVCVRSNHFQDFSTIFDEFQKIHSAVCSFVKAFQDKIRVLLGPEGSSELLGLDRNPKSPKKGPKQPSGFKEAPKDSKSGLLSPERSRGFLRVPIGS